MSRRSRGAFVAPLFYGLHAEGSGPRNRSIAATGNSAFITPGLSKGLAGVALQPKNPHQQTVTGRPHDVPIVSDGIRLQEGQNAACEVPPFAVPLSMLVLG